MSNIQQDLFIIRIYMRINYFHAASTLATARLITLSRYLSRAFSARSFPNYK